MLKHVVLIRIKEGGSAERCARLLAGLRQRVPDVRSVTWGRNVVPAQGAFDFGFVLEFDSLDGLGRYDRSDYHQLIRQEIRAIRESSHSIDFFDPDTDSGDTRPATQPDADEVQR